MEFTSEEKKAGRFFEQNLLSLSCGPLQQTGRMRFGNCPSWVQNSDPSAGCSVELISISAQWHFLMDQDCQTWKQNLKICLALERTRCGEESCMPEDLFISLAVSLIVPLSLLTLFRDNEDEKEELRPVMTNEQLAPRGRLAFGVGVGALLFVPILKQMTGLPPAASRNIVDHHHAIHYESLGLSRERFAKIARQASGDK